jgi:FAS-associated factor 2
MQPNVLALGLSIHSGQGAQLAQMLKVQAYPALYLLEPPPRDASSSSTRTLTLLFQAEGKCLLDYSAEQLVPLLQSCVQRHQTILAEHEARRIEREQETLLRQQQDAEYQAALQADQERERQQAEAAAEEERQRREEEDRIAKAEREAQAVIDTARDTLRESPSSGGAMIRFVLPSGQKVNRRFYGDDTIGTCRAFVRLHCHENEIEMGTIGLSTNFPKKSYNDDDTVTLEDAGLAPQAVLMVQDLDA